MSSRIKNCLGLAIVIVLFVSAYASLSYVDSYSKSIQPSSFRSFSVSAEGKIVAIPDIAQFTFSVITEGDKDISNLQKENTGKINKAINFLKSKDIETKDIRTQNYSLNPRYQYHNCSKIIGSCPPPEIVGYTINQTVGVKVRDFDKIGDVLSGVIQNGANSVSQLSFTIDDSTLLENQARTEAIKKAKTRAESVAKAAGFHLGRLLSIEEGYAPFYGLGYGGGEMSVKAEAALPSPIIEAGSKEIAVTMTLRYEIE